MKFLTIQRISLSLLFITCLLFSGVTFAEKSTTIYKWTDKDGSIHYAARPGDKSAVKMNSISKSFTNKNDSKTEQEKDNRDKMCQDAQNTKKKYQSAPFLFRNDKETGEKIRLTEQESKDAFLRVEKDISYWCSPEQQAEANKK
ncbi:MAG: DUF4124 domain-containing protein [gamma proteobacterium symbiont of Taylorina sp.]|nr:DUF4124 domain-containing protein [gamma proteobacterium symbiont of Taylorina sp.]